MGPRAGHWPRRAVAVPQWAVAPARRGHEPLATSVAAGRAGARAGAAVPNPLPSASAECGVLHHGDWGPQRGQVLTHQLTPETAPQERYCQPHQLARCSFLEQPLLPETQVAKAHRSRAALPPEDPGSRPPCSRSDSRPADVPCSALCRVLAVQSVSRVAAF